MSNAVKTENKACQACAYWKALDGNEGECRRHAPQTLVFRVDDETQFESKFPVTSGTDWCGDFEPK